MPLSCPFDKKRSGVVISEGATIVIIEELGCALKRNAKIYGEILSVSSNFDPHRFYKYNPSGGGMADAMTSALINANINPESIDCIFANANSTKDADLIESNSIKKAFKGHSSKVFVTAIKSMTGESLSPSGITALAAAAGSLELGFIPPTINYSEQDLECNLNYVLTKPKFKKLAR